MTLDERLVDLLLCAEDLHQQGQRVTAEELCRDCPELVVRLQELLRGTSAVEKLLPAPALEHTVDATSPPDRPAAAPWVRGYTIRGELGRGGMGVVYKARQIKANRVVALKMILAGSYADEVQLARFRTEVEAIAHLQHPHIVQVFEVGEHEGQPFFSLEYCVGGSLSRHLHGTPLPAREAARLVEILAAAIHAAHQQGIIHRDLKPANILLASGGCKPPDSSTPSGDLRSPLADWVPKITDFGLAKRMEDAGQTASGVVMGTPSYMAPEQAGGEKSHIGPTADIYALGAILYELLTGRPPFRAATTMDTILQVLYDEPVPPRQLQPRTPRDLETICLKCLHKDAARRYATAADLAGDLGRWLRDEPIQARPVGRLERTAKWVRRRPAAASLLAVAAALPLLALVLAGWYLERQQEFNRDLQAEKRAADDQRDEAKKQKQLTLDAYRDSQLRLMQMHVAAGVRLMQDGDAFAALPWLVTALKEDPRDAATREMHRYRIGALLRQSPRLTRMFFRPGSVVHVEFSYDGRLLLTTHWGHTARLWDLATGKEVRILRHNGPAILAASFSPDGRQVLTVSGDPKVHVWDAASGKITRTLTFAEGVKRAYFSPDGRRLVVSASRGARVWDARTGAAVSPLLEEAGQILQALAISPDGGWVVMAGENGAARVWEVSTGKPITPPLQHDQKAIKHAVFSPDGSQVATTSSNWQLRVWQVRKGFGRLVWQAEDGGSKKVRFSPDGSCLVSYSGFTAKLWNARTGKPLAQFAHHGTVWDAVFSPDGQWVATTAEDLTARVWDAAIGLPVTPPLKHARLALEAAFSPDGRFLATACTDGAARVWDLGGTKPLARWSYPGKSRDLSPDTRYFVALTEADRAVQVLDSGTGKAVGPPWRLPAAVRYAAFSPDSRLVVAACTDKTARLWEIASGKESCPPLKHDSDVLVATVSPAAARMATGCKDGTVHVWDLATGKELVAPLRHAGLLHSIQFSADGKRLLTAGKDLKARVWDAATGRPLSPFMRHEILEPGHLRINSGGPAWSPDGKLLATTNGFSVVVVNATTGQPAGPLLFHNGGLATLMFHPEGKRLLSTSNDSTALQWEVATGKRLTPAMRHSGFVRDGSYSPDGRRIATCDSFVARMWDAATGLPLGPPLQSGRGFWPLLRFSPDGQRLFLWMFNTGTTSVWDVSRDDRPVEDLEKLANLLAGHQLDANGGLAPLAPDDLRKLWEELSAKYPKDFSASAMKIGPLFWMTRAKVSIRLQQWDKAAEDFLRIVAQQPKNHFGWYQAAPLLLQAGDIKGYQRHRREMLQRFGSTRNPALAERTAKACLLVPGTPEEQNQAAQLAERAVRVGAKHPYRSYFEFAKALAEYRQGHFVRAEHRLQPILAANQEADYLIVPSYLVLAMSQQRQGQSDKAHESLKRATQLMDGLTLAMAGDNWHDWLMCQLLRREAEGLCEQGPGPLEFEGA